MSKGEKMLLINFQSLIYISKHLAYIFRDISMFVERLLKK